MYTNGSEEFNRLIETPNNKAIQKRLVFEDTGRVIDKFKTLIMYSSSNNQELQIGTTNMSYLDVEAFTDIAIFDGQKLRLECGVELSDGSMEYAPMGIFTAVNTEKGLNSVKFTANDNMQKTEKLYTSSLTYPTTSDKIISEICEICEIELATPIENPIAVTEKLQGYTCREVLGFIAGIHGKFACFDRLGQLNLRWYSEMPIEKQNSLIWSFTKSQEPFIVDKIEIAKNTETKFTSGEGNNIIYHSNPLATQQITDDILDDLRGFSYSTSNIEMLDDIRLDIWDVIKVTYLDGNEYFIPCMSIRQNMGASSTNIESFSKSKTQNQYRYEGATTQFLNRMATELLITNRVVANKVDTDYVDAQVGKINTLIFGSATGNVISTQFSNSVIAQLGDAQIKSAMIQDVSASKISAGTIYTNDVTIQSQNGQMMLKDNTIQISDGTRARVQIGKDASNDYSINVWDKGGKLMFSQGGITDAAIKDAIIRNDMVSENANIHAGKLDISSLFTEINGNTTRSIKATKIYIDEKGQSLEFAFKQMTTTVDNITQTQTSQGTQLEIINGQISSKIWQQDITSAIDNVDIGGRNLLLDSKEFSKTTTQNQTGIVLDIGKFTDYYMITRATGKQIAISFDWETTATSGTFRLTFNNTPWASIFPNSTITITPTNQKGRVEYIATLTEVAVDSSALYTALRLRIDNVDGTTIIKNVKCEYGNKSTDWTPAPEEIETKVTSLTTKYSTLEQDVNGFKTTVAETYTTLDEFKALSIGGSNLFRDTRTMVSPKYFIVLEDTLTLRQEDGYGIATLPANSDWNGISLFFQEKIEDLIGKQVTLSFDAKSDGLTLNKNQWLVQMAVFDSSFNRLKIKAVAYLNSTRYFNTQDYVDNEWVRCRVTFTLAAVGDMTFEMDGEATKYAVQIYSGEENDMHLLEVRKIKCEYGNKNTDWTPSPDDIEENFAEVTTKYSTLEQDVDSFKTTVMETYSTKGETQLLKSTLEQNVNTFKTEVSNTYSTKDETQQVRTIATQTANKFKWVVKDSEASTSSNFTLTDRMAELTADIISLNGNVKVSKDMIVDGAITTDKISANAITADKVDITNLFAQEIQVNGKFKAIGSAWIPPTKEEISLLRSFVYGETTLTPEQKIAFDFNADGKVDLLDATILKASVLLGLNIPERYPDYNPINSNINVVIDPKNTKKIIEITATNSFGRNIDVFFGMDGINVPSVDTGLINCYSVNSQDDVIANYGADNQTSLSDLHNINNMIKVLYNGTVTANSEGVMTIVFDNTYAKKLSRMGVMFIQINDSTGTHYGYTAIPYLNNASSWGTYGDKIFNIYANNGGIDTVKLTRSSDASAHTTVTIKPNVSNTYAEKKANVRIFSLSLGVL